MIRFRIRYKGKLIYPEHSVSADAIYLVDQEGQLWHVDYSTDKYKLKKIEFKAYKQEFSSRIKDDNNIELYENDKVWVWGNSNIGLIKKQKTKIEFTGFNKWTVLVSRYSWSNVYLHTIEHIEKV